MPNISILQVSSVMTPLMSPTTDVTKNKNDWVPLVGAYSAAVVLRFYRGNDRRLGNPMIIKAA
jgi:hypothetical protein